MKVEPSGMGLEPLSESLQGDPSPGRTWAHDEKKALPDHAGT